MKTIPAVELADSHFFGQICYSIYRVLFCSGNGHSADLQQKRLYAIRFKLPTILQSQYGYNFILLCHEIMLWLPSN